MKLNLGNYESIDVSVEMDGEVTGDPAEAGAAILSAVWAQVQGDCRALLAPIELPTSGPKAAGQAALMMKGSA